MNKKCKHGTRESYCKICGGTSICEHNKRKDRCKHCGGSQICKHGVDKYGCKPCEGSAFCIHNREHKRCSSCNVLGAYKKYRVGATERELSFSLSFEDFDSLVSKPCHFCKESKVPRGLDRWDNMVGYEKSNCVPCCPTCNFAKKKMLGSDFILMCQRVSATHPS